LGIYSFLLLFDFYPLANSNQHHEEIVTRPRAISITITEIIVIICGLSIEIDEIRQVSLRNFCSATNNSKFIESELKLSFGRT
jgi:hypothetical protein